MVKNSKNSPRQLVLVAGPSRIGKSTLMKEMDEGRLMGQFEKQGLKNITEWKHMSANEWHENPSTHAEHVILHFDLYAQFQLQNRVQLLKTLLKQYDDTYVLILCTHYKLLRSRVADRLIQLFRTPSALVQNHKFWKQLRKRSKKYVFYSRLSNIVGLYAQLNEILSDHPNVRARWLIDTSKRGSFIIQPMEQALFLDLLSNGNSPGPGISSRSD